MNIQPTNMGDICDTLLENWNMHEGDVGQIGWSETIQSKRAKYLNWSFSH